MKRGMRRYAVLLPALLLMLPVLLTGCSSTEDPAAIEALEALEMEYSAASEDIETMEEYNEVIGSFRARYEALADEFWGTGAGFDAKLWLVQMGTAGMEDAESETAVAEGLEALFTEYRRSEHLSKLTMYYDDLSEERQTWLREGSPHATVRAATIYYLASYAESQIAYGGDEVDRDAMMAQRKANLDLLVNEYHNTPLRDSTYGAKAELMLSAHDPSELAIGQKAPEIIGTDVDGNEMKLSDYLGKVLVIDFWGDW